MITKYLYKLYRSQDNYFMMNYSVISLSIYYLFAFVDDGQVFTINLPRFQDFSIHPKQLYFASAKSENERLGTVVKEAPKLEVHN